MKENSSVIFEKLLLGLGSEMKKAENMFEGYMALLGASSGIKNEIEPVLLKWIDSINLDYYLGHSEHFSNFLAFAWTICHFLDVSQGKKVWKKIMLFYSQEKRLDLIGEMFGWSIKFEYKLDSVTEIEWIADADFSMDPNLMARTLLLFGKSQGILINQ